MALDKVSEGEYESSRSGSSDASLSRLSKLTEEDEKVCGNKEPTIGSLSLEGAMETKEESK